MAKIRLQYNALIASTRALFNSYYGRPMWKDYYKGAAFNACGNIPDSNVLIQTHGKVKVCDDIDPRVDSQYAAINHSYNVSDTSASLYLEPVIDYLNMGNTDLPASGGYSEAKAYIRLSFTVDGDDATLNINAPPVIGVARFKVYDGTANALVANSDDGERASINLKHKHKYWFTAVVAVSGDGDPSPPYITANFEQSVFSF